MKLVYNNVILLGRHDVFLAFPEDHIICLRSHFLLKQNIHEYKLLNIFQIKYVSAISYHVRRLCCNEYDFMKTCSF